LNGYYAQGVGPETAKLPAGWQNRLVAIHNENTNGITGLCLDVHDLAISKLVAARTKDMEFIQELAQHDMIQKGTMLERLGVTDLKESARKGIATRINSILGRTRVRKNYSL
jgi:hypothetical protein